MTEQCPSRYLSSTYLICSQVSLWLSLYVAPVLFTGSLPLGLRHSVPPLANRTVLDVMEPGHVLPKPTVMAVWLAEQRVLRLCIGIGIGIGAFAAEAVLTRGSLRLWIHQAVLWISLLAWLAFVGGAIAFMTLL